jgi:shikimate dehydrogenase
LRAASSTAANLLSGLVGSLPQARQDGRSVTIGLLGRGIGSSRSPIMHEREGARLGLDYAYRLIDFDQLGLDDAALGAMIDSAEELGFSGLNVTHPFKQSVLPLLNDLSPEAAAIGAVNTIVLRDGRRIGHNTDSWGFAESFRAGMQDCSLAHVLQLGAGGAGAAVAYALLELGTVRLSIFDRDLPRAKQLAGRLRERFDARIEAPPAAEPAFPQARGIVNTTPVGMAKYPGVPFDSSLLSVHQWVAEIIYFPAETELLRLARWRGCRTLPGLGMAIYQAVRAFELFTGLQPDRAAMAAHFAQGGAPS